MGQKVTFDSANKIVQINEAPTNGVVDIDVKVDIYSDGKEDWKSDSTLNKFLFPVTAIGGDPLPGSKKLGTTFFLEYGWKIRPYEGSHQLNVNGNLYSRDGSNPFTTTVGTYNVQIISSVSSLVDSTVQQLPEIEYASFNGGVSYNENSGISGTGYTSDGRIIGTPRAPVDNPYDAYDIAVERGFTQGFISGDMNTPTDLPLDGFTFNGEGKDRTNIIIPDAATVQNCTFIDARVTGYLDGSNTLFDCLLENLHYIKGYIEECILNAGTITLGGNDEAHFIACASGAGTPTIDCGGSGQGLVMRRYSGDVRITNKTGTEPVSIDLSSGTVTLDSTVTNGEITIRGDGILIDNSTGATVYNLLTNSDNFAKEVWESDPDLYAAGTMGHWVKNKLMSVSKFLGLK